MPDMSLKALVDLILGNVGTLGLLLIILYAGFKKWWVFGWYAVELKQRNDRLENRIDVISGATRSITSLAERTAQIAEQRKEVTSE